MNTKTCSICKLEKVVTDYYVNRSSPWPFCKECHKIRYAERHKSPAVKAYKRRYNLATRYGITEVDVQIYKEAQRGLCGICNIELGNKYMVDHDHSTGQVRGLLCSPCNMLLGHYEARQLSPMDIENYLNP